MHCEYMTGYNKTLLKDSSSVENHKGDNRLGTNTIMVLSFFALVFALVLVFMLFILVHIRLIRKMHRIGNSNNSSNVVTGDETHQVATNTTSTTATIEKQASQGLNVDQEDVYAVTKNDHESNFFIDVGLEMEVIPKEENQIV